jgi:hypothetical protein
MFTRRTILRLAAATMLHPALRWVPAPKVVEGIDVTLEVPWRSINVDIEFSAGELFAAHSDRMTKIINIGADEILAQIDPLYDQG